MSATTHLEFGPLEAILLNLGWDITATDEIVGRKEGVWGVWTIALDHAGRIRFVSTKPTQAPEGRRLQRRNVRYRLLREIHSTLTVTTRITSAEMLEPVLDQLGRFARGQDG